MQIFADMVNRDHACYFSGAHAAKDGGIALKIAGEQGLNLPLAAVTKAQNDRIVVEGFGDLDKSGIAELIFPSPENKNLTKPSTTPRNLE